MRQAIGMPFDYDCDWDVLPNIYYIAPYALDLRYGKQINKHISIMPDDAWIVLTDYDTQFLTPNYGRIISNAIVKYGDDTDLFTCQTNRLGNPARCWMGERSDNFDIRHHARIARSLERDPGHECTEVKDRTVAGVCMIFPKSVWDNNKFDEHKIIHKRGDEITSFDTRWVRGIKGNIRRIEGLYIFHSYRMDKTVISEIDHLM